MALLNTAWHLAQRGHPVALLDLDLEAPGLQAARLRQTEEGWREPELKPGFWQLSDLVEATPGGAPVRQTHLAIPTNLDPNELLDRFVAPATSSIIWL